jgi:acetyl esterase/lipase
VSGALTTAVTVALCALAALWPPRPRHSTPWNLQFSLGFLVNEQPFLALCWLLGGTTAVWLHPDPGRPAWWPGATLLVLVALALGLVARRARTAAPALKAALVSAFGEAAAPRSTRPSWWRVTLLPFLPWWPGVRRIGNRRYGPARRGHRLDVYVPRRRPAGPPGPVLVYLHGGGFRIGSKRLGGVPLLQRLAAQGWVCVSADYRLRRVRYADQLADARAAVDWARAHAASHGGDPDRLFTAGGSAGAHLAATVALSGTGVRGVIGLYGYYGSAGRPDPEPTSPSAYAGACAPPFLIVHGALDTLVLREDARAFADGLRGVSRSPVAYAELPGTHHNFDLFDSVRLHAVTDAVARFAELAAAAGDTDHEAGGAQRA